MRVAPKLSAADNIDGGTAAKAAREAMIMVGKVIMESTNPPTKGEERGRPKKLIKIANPSTPKMIDGTAAKLLILISIKSNHLLRGANISKYKAANTAIGNETKKPPAKTAPNR